MNHKKKKKKLVMETQVMVFLLRHKVCLDTPGKPRSITTQFCAGKHKGVSMAHS